jgi:iron(III) transport system ATP-binding protein
VSVCGVAKRFGELAVLHSIDLEIGDGEVMVLLGPSGCGKTTLLRLIAGLETVDAGEIVVGGDVVSGKGRHVLPEHRRVGLVFQNGALFSNLTVAENVGFGLPKGERRHGARIDDMLELVGLAGAGPRHPDQLSGGQQQRVALARALAPSPSVLLFDEPFSNLDAILRSQLRAEVAEVVRHAGTTSVFVTHDRAEAFALADHIAVMTDGRIEQVGSAKALYDDPSSEWVATFVGDATTLAGTSDGSFATTSLGSVTVRPGSPTGSVSVVVRPEQVSIQPVESGNGRVVSVQYAGSTSRVQVAIDGDTAIEALVTGASDLSEGEVVAVRVDGPCAAFAR